MSKLHSKQREKSLLALEKGKNQGSVDSTNSQRKDLEAGLGRPLRVDLLKQMTPRGKRTSHSAAWGQAIFPCRNVCVWNCWEHSGSCGLHSGTSLSPLKHWKGWEERCAHRVCYGLRSFGALQLFWFSSWVFLCQEQPCPIPFNCMTSQKNPPACCHLLSSIVSWLESRPLGHVISIRRLL